MEEAVQDGSSPADIRSAWQDTRDSIEWNDASRPSFDIETCGQQVLKVLHAGNSSSCSSGTPPPSLAARSRDSGGEPRRHQSPSALCQIMRWANQKRDSQNSSKGSSDDAMDVAEEALADSAVEDVDQPGSTQLNCQAQQFTNADRMAHAHSPAWTTPQVKRTRRTSKQKWFPSANAERRKRKPSPGADEDTTAVAAADVEIAEGDAAAAALAALQDYKAKSASVLQEYEVQTSKSFSDILAPVLSPAGSCSAPRQLGDARCRILASNSGKALVHAASRLVIEAWQACCDTDQARVLILLPRARLLLWYQSSLTWDRVHGIPVGAFTSDASQGPGQLCRKDEGGPGVCLVIDALLADADGSPSDSASVPTPPSGSGPLSAEQKSRKRKRRRPSHSVDDDDSGNDTLGTNVQGAPSQSSHSPPWDLVIIDSSASSSQDTTTALDRARSLLRGVDPKQWLILQAAAPGPPSSSSSGDISAEAIMDVEQHHPKLLKVPTPLRLSAEKRRFASMEKEEEHKPTSPGPQLGGS